jgi:putative glutathione S-transferase
MTGQLIDGKWVKEGDWAGKDGRFNRQRAAFRDRITRDGSSGYPAEAGRYHLYVSYACPWAHRTIITRALRGLESAVGMSVVDPQMGDDGWVFTGAPGTEPDTVNGAQFLRDIYLKADARYTGRVTVPVLWDKVRGTIVCNESREVMRMLDVELDALAEGGPTLAPPELLQPIDEVLDAIYNPINNGVYRAGFAKKQEAYEEACTGLFAALERWEDHLGRQRYLCGDRITEADIALFTTLLRFDLVYYSHFKCNLRRIQDCPNLYGFLRDVYQTPGVAETCNLDHIKCHYYWSQTNVNPSRIVPLGPAVDLTSPHGRERIQGA